MKKLALISDCYVKSLFQAQELVIVGMEAAFTAIFVENLESACLAERTMIQEQASSYSIKTRLQVKMVLFVLATGYFAFRFLN